MLSVQFRYADDLTDDVPVRVKERRGAITYDLCRGLYLPEGVVALNAAAARVIAGGQWFQLWKGEIVSLCSPPTRRIADGRLHRGPLVDQAAGPRDW